MHRIFSVIIYSSIVIPTLQECTRQDYIFPTDFLPKCKPEDYCFTLDPERSHTILFSTKTAYRTEESHDRQTDFTVQDCTPSKIWLLIRHGTRLPTAKGIVKFSKMEKFKDEIVENAENQKRIPVCERDWNIFKQWKWNCSITEDKENYLVLQGFKELRSIAYNFKRYLPDLFDGPYDVEKFHFRHTDTERTRSSFRAFVNELFGENAHEKIDAETPSHQPDLLLKAYANCAAWRDQKKRLNRPMSEAKKFENSKEFKKLMAEIDSRLGFNENLEVRRAKDIYDLCRYEQAWHIDNASIWCSLLKPSQVRIFEYQEDLNYYYKSSHGSKLNKNVKCFAMNDMLNRLSTDNNNNQSNKTTVYFTHSAAVQLLLTSLGAFKDEIDLKADNFTQMSFRKWKTSQISPFAANVAAVRYTCPNNDNDKVKFFLNEKVLHLDWCTPDGVCNWHDFQQKYSFYANGNCDQIFCNEEM